MGFLAEKLNARHVLEPENTSEFAWYIHGLQIHLGSTPYLMWPKSLSDRMVNVRQLLLSPAAILAAGGLT
jgi:hypothetical protein